MMDCFIINMDIIFFFIFSKLCKICSFLSKVKKNIVMKFFPEPFKIELLFLGILWMYL